MYYKKRVEVHVSALKHGVHVADVRHVYEHSITVFGLDGEDPTKFLIVGPDRSSRMLEVIAVDAGDRHVLIHAMKLRRRYVERLMETND